MTPEDVELLGMHAEVRVLRREIARLRGLAATCRCWDGNHDNFEGILVDCPVHGLMRAYNAAMDAYRQKVKENEALLAQLHLLTNPTAGSLVDTEVNWVDRNDEH